MTKLTQERALQIIKKNKDTIYHLPSGYPAIRHYLGKGYLRKTLLNILSFLKELYEYQDGDNHIVIDNHRYEFFVSTNRLSYAVRNSSGKGTSNRHINFLCAMGIFQKIPQNDQSRLVINQNMKAIAPNKRDLNVYSFRELKPAVLKRIEERSERLMHAGITAGNMSFNQLWLAITDLDDIAREVYPDRRARKAYTETKEYKQFQELTQCIDLLIDTYGYASKRLISDNMTLSEAKISRLYRLFKKHLEQKYLYKKPTAQQKQEFNLQDQKYIFTKKGG